MHTPRSDARAIDCNGCRVRINYSRNYVLFTKFLSRKFCFKKNVQQSRKFATIRYIILRTSDRYSNTHNLKLMLIYIHM